MKCMSQLKELPKGYWERQKRFSEAVANLKRKLKEQKENNNEEDL
jgi:hypothetical protein